MDNSDRKLLIEMEKKNNTTDNFRFGFGRFLDRIGYSYKFKYIYEISEADLNWCDAYIAVRPNTPMSYSIARVIKASGRNYVVFFDDDLINRNNSISQRNKASIKCLEISDAVFGVNPALCEEYGKQTSYSFYINTAVEDSELSRCGHTGDCLEVVYAAGKDHAAIFEAIIKPVLKPLLERYHDKIHFTFVGVKPRLSDIGYAGCFSYVPMMPLDLYSEFMRTHTFDLGLAPLEDDKFSRMKYFNKYIEYSKCGIPGLYSNIQPYTYVVQNAKNGFLIKNTFQDWYRAFEYAVSHMDELRGVGSAAQEDLRNNYSLEHITDELQGHLENVLTSNKRGVIRWKQNKVVIGEFYICDKCSKLIYHIHNCGIKDTVSIALDRVKSR